MRCRLPWLNHTIPKEKRVSCRFVLFLFLLPISVYSYPPGYAGETSADPDKLAIVQLIEDHLAAAYTVRTELETPDFGTLDRIYPDWHSGDPAKARKTLDEYKIYIVSYEVHSVYLTQPDMAEVKGEKQVTTTRRVKFLKFFGRTKEETSKIQFTIICRRNESGDWEIMKETEG